MVKTHGKKPWFVVELVPHPLNKTNVDVTRKLRKKMEILPAESVFTRRTHVHPRAADVRICGTHLFVKAARSFAGWISRFAQITWQNVLSTSCWCRIGSCWFLPISLIKSPWNHISSRWLPIFNHRNINTNPHWIAPFTSLICQQISSPFTSLIWIIISSLKWM